VLVNLLYHSLKEIFSSGKYLVSHAKYANKTMQAGFNLMSVTVAHLNHSFNVSTDFRKPPVSWRKHSKKLKFKATQLTSCERRYVNSVETQKKQLSVFTQPTGWYTNLILGKRIW
jgi:hypothetical protein